MQQYETAQFLAPVTRDRLAGELVCYGRSVVSQEWPGMESGDLDNTINPWGLTLFRTIHSANPATAVQETAFAKWLDQTSDREEARRDRVHGATGITPTTIWIVLFLSAAIVFAFMLFFADPAELKRSQAMLIGSAVTVVSVTLLAIYALDNPYRPIPEAFAPSQWSARSRFSGRHAKPSATRSEIPCDDQGVAAR